LNAVAGKGKLIVYASVAGSKTEGVADGGDQRRPLCG
jgi:hypothetical protein